MSEQQIIAALLDGKTLRWAGGTLWVYRAASGRVYYGCDDEDCCDGESDDIDAFLRGMNDRDIAEFEEEAA